LDERLLGEPVGYTVLWGGWNSVQGKERRLKQCEDEKNEEMQEEGQLITN
jgi:hypothetical protein